MNDEVYGRSILQKHIYGPDERTIDFMFNPYGTESIRKKLSEGIKKASENLKQFGVLKPAAVGKDEFTNKKEEFEMDYLEGSFVIEKQDKGFVIEIATEYNCKVLVSESYHMYQAVGKMPEAMVMIIDDIKAEMKRQEKIRMAKEVLGEEE